MKALYIRLVLFLIGPALRHEFDRRDAESRRRSAELMNWSKDLAAFQVEFFDQRRQKN